jgi:diguanylate cyclase (GGDEF)-like protein/PAS domain S-box-containing protein
MEPVLHALRPRPPNEPIELTPAGRTMARALGWILLCGPSLALVWLVLPAGRDAAEAGMLAVVLAGWALGALLLSGRVDDRSPRFFEGVLSVTTLLISLAVFFSHSPASGLCFLYVWFVPLAYAFFPLRRAVLQTLVMAASLAIALLAQQGHDPELRPLADVALSVWLFCIGAVVMVGAIIRRVVSARQASLDRLARGFADVSVGLAVVSADWRWLEVNDALCLLLARPREELLGHSPAEITHPEDVGESRGVVEGGLRHGRRAQTFVKRYLRPDGEIVWASVDSLRFDRQGGEPFFFCVIRDITEQRRAHHRLSRQAAEQSAVARLGRFALGEQDLDATTHEVASVVAATLEIDHCVVMELESDGTALRVVAGVGLQEGVLRGMRVPAPPDSLLALALGQSEPLVVGDVEADPRLRDQPLLREFIVGSGMSCLVRTRTDAWGLLAVYSETTRAFAPDEVEFLAAVANVVSGAVERHRVEEGIRDRALHDPLTGLPNRTLVLDRLAGALARRRRDEGAVAVVLLDLDHFKLVNDSLGHQAGDELLIALAPRLEDAVRPSDTVARLGGDEFVVVCEDLDGVRAAIQVAERLVGAVSQPLVLGDEEHFATASLGIALAESADADPQTLIRDADAAMNRAKERGRGRYELFDASLRQRVIVRLRTEGELRRALERDELLVHYQPVVDLRDGSIAAVEAVVRWQHPQRGLLEPLDFIHVAEETGLIVPLGDVVLATGCRDVAGWQRRSSDAGPPVMLSVNASAMQIADTAFPARVAEIARRSGLAAGSLAIEITESVLIQEAHAPVTALNRMREYGLVLMLDDFGTGYSGLSYLRRFPLDVLKIDRSFVAGLGADEGDSAIVTAIIGMARTLGLTVVAEGVENRGQLAQLMRLDCDRAQGFLFAPPIPADRIERMIATGSISSG